MLLNIDTSAGIVKNISIWYYSVEFYSAVTATCVTKTVLFFLGERWILSGFFILFGKGVFKCFY